MSFLGNRFFFFVSLKTLLLAVSFRRRREHALQSLGRFAKKMVGVGLLSSVLSPFSSKTPFHKKLATVGKSDQFDVFTLQGVLSGRGWLCGFVSKRSDVRFTC